MVVERRGRLSSCPGSILVVEVLFGRKVHEYLDPGKENQENERGERPGACARARARARARVR